MSGLVSQRLDGSPGGQSSRLPPVSPSTARNEFNLGRSASEPSFQKSSFSRSLPEELPAALKGSFLPRQLGHPTVTARRSLAQKRKALMTNTRLFEDFSFYGAQGVSGFVSHLRSRFGSVLAGWRVLDEGKTGRLSFHPFFKAARKMGFHGNMKRLWAELDKSGKGYVTLEDIDPEVWTMVSGFKVALMKKYGDMLSAWLEGLDRSGTGKVTAEDVQRCVDELGLDMNGKKLLGMFVSVPGAPHMLLVDFDPKAHVRWLTESFIPGDADTETDGSGEEVRTDRKRLGVSTKDALIDALISRYGSVFRAWREVLDPAGRDRLSWGEFTHVFRRLGLSGDLQGLWSQLDTEQLGIIRLADLDEDLDALWSDMRASFKQEHGNMLRAWMKGVDVNAQGYVGRDDFVQACKQVGFLKNADVLFDFMRPPGEGSFLTLQDFDAKAHKAFMRNDFRMLDEPDQRGTPSPLEMTLEERTEKGFFFRIRKGWETSKSAEFAMHCKVYVPPKQEEVHPESFVNLCSRKYGSMVAAWRFGIDPKGRGQLNFNEFCTAVRRLGYRGSLRKLWAEICPLDSYVIRLKDIVKENGDAVTLFFEAIHERYEDLATLWSDLFKKDDAYSSVTLDDLKRGCKELEIPGDMVDMIFHSLQPTPGVKDILFLWDLDDMFVTTRRLWERKKPKHLRRPVKPVGTSLIVAKETNEARIRAQKEAEAKELGESLIVQHAATPQLVRHALERDFVSTVACWNLELDWRGKGTITRSQFLAMMYRCGICGNLQKLWDDFTQHRGDEASMSFMDLDPDAQAFLNDCRGELLKKYKTLTQAWHEGVDPGHLEIVDLKDFTDACKDVLPLLKDDKVSTLFHYLMARHGQRSIRKENWRILLTGLPPSKRPSAWGQGDDDDSSHLNTVFWEQEETRQIDTLDGFKRMLKAKYGSFFAAWKYALDREHNGYVMKQDFCLTCRRLGVKEVASIWREFLECTDKKNLITLEVLDAETAECWSELYRLLLKASVGDTPAAPAVNAAPQDEVQKDDEVQKTSPLPDEPGATNSVAANLDPEHDVQRSVTPEKKPNLKEGWRRAFDPRNIRRVERPRFFEGCKKLGYSKDPGRLFDLLRPERFREYLVYEDLVTDLNPNKFVVKANVKDTYLPMKNVATEEEVSLR